VQTSSKTNVEAEKEQQQIEEGGQRGTLGLYPNSRIAAFVLNT